MGTLKEVEEEMGPKNGDRMKNVGDGLDLLREDKWHKGRWMVGMEQLGCAAAGAGTLSQDL